MHGRGFHLPAAAIRPSIPARLPRIEAATLAIIRQDNRGNSAILQDYFGGIYQHFKGLEYLPGGTGSTGIH